MAYVHICDPQGANMTERVVCMYGCLCSMHRYYTVEQPLSSSSQEMSNSEVIVSSSSRQVVPSSQQHHFNQETMVLLHIFLPICSFRQQDEALLMI